MERRGEGARGEGQSRRARERGRGVWRSPLAPPHQRRVSTPALLITPGKDAGGTAASSPSTPRPIPPRTSHAPPASQVQLAAEKARRASPSSRGRARAARRRNSPRARRGEGDGRGASASGGETEGVGGGGGGAGGAERGRVEMKPGHAKAQAEAAARQLEAEREAARKKEARRRRRGGGRRRRPSRRAASPRVCERRSRQRWRPRRCHWTNGSPKRWRLRRRSGSALKPSRSGRPNVWRSSTPPHASDD